MSAKKLKHHHPIDESIISAGFGGQGIMVLGKVLANAGMEGGLHVTYLPAYGAEVRGGTAYSMVRICSSFIASPVIFNPSAAIMMNEPSLDKFESSVKEGGLLVVNTSLINRPPRRKDVEVVEVPLTDEAIKLGDVRVANMIAVGIYMTRQQTFDEITLLHVIMKMAVGFEDRIPINVKAIERGIVIANQG